MKQKGEFKYEECFYKNADIFVDVLIKQRETINKSLNFLKLLKGRCLATKNTYPITQQTPICQDNATQTDSIEDSDLAEEKEKKKQIVSVLLHDQTKLLNALLSEKKKSTSLTQVLVKEKERNRRLASELEEETKRSLALEADVENLLRQTKEREERHRLRSEEEECLRQDLEESLKRTKQEADHLRKQLAEAHRVAMSQATATANVLVNQSHSNFMTSTSTLPSGKSNYATLPANKSGSKLACAPPIPPNKPSSRKSLPQESQKLDFI